jgi:acyl-CoA synthetase (AMP-forming)/AMP-acid ligase II
MENSLGADDKIGQRLLAHVLDYRAKEEPAGLFGTVPLVVDDHRPGWRKVTYGEIARAVDFTAWWIEKHLGLGTKAETLTYMGANDIRYIIMSIACFKTRHSVSCPSRLL